MNERISGKEIWNEAARTGLILGLVSVAYMFITMLSGKLGSASKMMALLISLLNFLLWAAKFVGCILLMKLFLTRFADSHKGLWAGDLKRYGRAIALTSALIYAAATLINALYVSPEALSDAFSTVMAQYSSSMSSSDMEAIQNIQGDMPAISFFSTLIYCYLFGTVLTLILAPKIASNNIFNDTSDSSADEQ